MKKNTKKAEILSAVRLPIPPHRQCQILSEEALSEPFIIIA